MHSRGQTVLVKAHGRHGRHTARYSRATQAVGLGGKEGEEMCTWRSVVQEKVAAGEKVPVEVEGSTYEISCEMVTIEKKTKTVHGQNIIPSVIEPSFGIGRVLYCVFEHTFYTRKDDAQKTVFKFAPTIAPIKVTVFPLLQQQQLNSVAQEISLDLRRAGISSLMDTTGLSPTSPRHN
jgi:glycyl-tRNA synthetase